MHRGSKHIAYKAGLWLSPDSVDAIERGTFHIWRAELQSTSSDLSYYRALLSADEKERADKFRFKKDQESFITGRGILRSLLGIYLQCSPASITFEYNEFGKPLLPESEPLQFNLSHAGGTGLFAFGLDAPVGVDLEVLNPEIEITKLVRRFFSKNEAQVILNLAEAEQMAAFFKCWTRKEAFIKGHGEGLGLPLDQFEVSIHDDKNTLLKATHWDREEAGRWQLFSFEPGKNQMGAAAIKGTVREIELLDYKIDLVRKS